MARRRRRRVLARLQELVREGRYRFSGHARDEMQEEELWDEDVRGAILRGQLVRTQTDDPRGPRYTIEGTAVDGRKIRAVVRLVLENVRIITVYVAK